MNNPLNNLPPFYVGQKVVCIMSGLWIYKGQRLSGPKLNEKNVIESVTFCEESNKWFVDLVGYEENQYNSEHFKPVQESPFPSLTYSKVVEKESELISLN